MADGYDRLIFNIQLFVSIGFVRSFDGHFRCSFTRCLTCCLRCLSPCFLSFLHCVRRFIFFGWHSCLYILHLVIMLLVIRRALLSFVVHRSPTELCSRSQVSPRNLLLGGGLSAKLTVGDLREFQLVGGNFDRLYNDDSLSVRHLGATSVATPEGCVSCQMPLHRVAPFVPSTLRRQLASCLPGELVSNRMPVVELRSLAARLCCSGVCIGVSVVFDRPSNSVVNPFHIHRAGLQRSLEQRSEPLSSLTASPCVPPGSAIGIPLRGEC